jgi:hypothetical protein
MGGRGRGEEEEEEEEEDPPRQGRRETGLLWVAGKKET